MKKVNYLDKCNLLSEIEVSYKTKIKPVDRVKISNSKDSYNALLSVFDAGQIEHVEEFVILLLNRANQVLGWYKLSKGGISGTVADTRVIFQLALGANACGVILAHNHPSGNPKPSEQDKLITKKIREAGKILEISILDHIIVTPDSYYSFSDEGGI